jgi:hypothetical protein
MMVTGSDTTLLFCEGMPESLDARLLNHLLRGQTKKLVIASRGKYGLRSFIDGYLASYLATPTFFGFRDRDFDVEPPNTVALIVLPGRKPIYLSYRACVESYLLDPALIDTYWVENDRLGGRVWRHGPSPGVAVIQEWIQAAAESIRHYQAARWALASIKPSNRWPEVRTTWTDGSGHLPASMASEFCLEQAKRLVLEYAAQSGSVSEQVLVERFQEYVKKFTSDTFWSRYEYSVWFHGKDLQKAMERVRPNSFSLTRFCSWAVDRLVPTAHADLMDLKARIGS